MIHLGIIGTNWITHQFVQAALATEEYELSAVYSRKIAKAQGFGEKYAGSRQYSDDLAEFFALEEMDTVYIASPNSLHFEQAQQAIAAGKNVIVEKPAFSTPKEMATIIKQANENQVFFFEAARNIHEESFKKMKEFLPTPNHIIGANFSYMKYSSRHDLVLQGEVPNIFSPHFSAGSLADLGVYLVYAALGWFGVPKEVHHFAQKIQTGVDGMGIIILRYDNFDVTLQHGKIGEAHLPSEIYFDDGTLWLDAVNSINRARLYKHTDDEGPLEIEVSAKENPMIEEASDFAKIIQHPNDEAYGEKYEEWVELARNVNNVIYELRKQAGVVFDADQE
ncbi:MAG: Gfo/Idh/MocA family oxidoreductase [Tetragenococcus koreensis]|nr:Gfo/Idh/MocA family oxidoreductase [Tetragenococcus koreensis]